jgi:hypothetical protein
MSVNCRHKFLYRVGKAISISIFILSINSCITIHNKKFLQDLDEIGDPQKSLRLDGYYYYQYEVVNYPYDKNRYGGYSQNLKAPYNQVRIQPIVLNKNGSLEKIGSYSGLRENLTFDFKEYCYLSDENSLFSAQNHFECYIRIHPTDKSYFPHFKSEIWDQGVFHIKGNEIKLQVFYNVSGNYYLYEERGIISGDTAFTLTSATDFQDGKKHEINRTFVFKKMADVPEIPSYILKHRKKFD